MLRKRILLFVILLAVAFPGNSAAIEQKKASSSGRLYGKGPVERLEYDRMMRLRFNYYNPIYYTGPQGSYRGYPYYYYQRRFYYGHPYYGYRFPYGYPYAYKYPYGYRRPYGTPYDYFGRRYYTGPQRYYGYPPNYYRDYRYWGDYLD
jgi:hypothetical protein